MSNSVSFKTTYDLANLTAPASGTTHGVKVDWIFTTAGTLSFPMTSLVQQVGDFQAQALMFDNSANTIGVTITEQITGWSRFVPAGTNPTFQFPSASDQLFVLSATGPALVSIMFLDWPAFPDWGSVNGNSPGSNVTVIGTVTVTGSVTANPYASTPLAGASHSIVAGGTAQTALAAGFATAGGYITNPINATESLFVDEVNAAQNVQGGGTNGTSVEIVPGGTYVVPPTNHAVSVNAATTGHVFVAIGRT